MKRSASSRRMNVSMASPSGWSELERSSRITYARTNDIATPDDPETGVKKMG
jgi:hypothetical protein